MQRRYGLDENSWEDFAHKCLIVIRRNRDILILDFGFRILDLTIDETTEHKMPALSIQNPKSKI